MAKKFGDDYLGPLFDPERYTKHCARRLKNGRKPITPRRFLKIQERRVRRSAKTALWRLKGEVKRRQNKALRTLIPMGTSLVFCSRLNFHKFKLYKRIMAVFQVLALCGYWDRTFTYCANRGIVLIETLESYTTKKFPVCNCHVNVGASKVFHCNKCGYKRPRDIKASRTMLWECLFWLG